jgi:hypothetical protein
VDAHAVAERSRRRGVSAQMLSVLREAFSVIIKNWKTSSGPPVMLFQGSESVLLARTKTVTRVRGVSTRTMQTSTISTCVRTMEDERRVRFSMVKRRILGALQTKMKTISNSVIVRVEAA